QVSAAHAAFVAHDPVSGIRTDERCYEEERRAHAPRAQRRQDGGVRVLVAVVEGEDDRIPRRRDTAVRSGEPFVKGDGVEPGTPQRIELRVEGWFADREPVRRTRNRVVRQDGNVGTARTGRREQQRRRSSARRGHRASGTPRTRSRWMSGTATAAITRSGRNAASGPGTP